MYNVQTDDSIISLNYTMQNINGVQWGGYVRQPLTCTCGSVRLDLLRKYPPIENGCILANRYNHITVSGSSDWIIFADR